MRLVMLYTPSVNLSASASQWGLLRYHWVGTGREIMVSAENATPVAPVKRGAFVGGILEGEPRGPPA